MVVVVVVVVVLNEREINFGGRERMGNAILNLPVPKSMQFLDQLNQCSVNLTYVS
jgi:hypothetical protein